VEHIQKNTPQDEVITIHLQKEFGNKLDKIPPDVITRFIRGYAHEKDRKTTTVDRLRYYLECFEKYDFPTISDEPWPEEKDCFGAWPVYIYGTDLQGHPLLIDELGCSPMSNFENVFGGDYEKLRKFRLRLMWRLSLRKEKLAKKYGVMIYKHTMIMDVSAVSMSTLNKFRTLVQDVISEEQHLFPETLHKLYIINAPWTFRAIWTIVSNFVDPLTNQKIHVLGSNYLEELLKVISKDELPSKYGGTCKIPIAYGNEKEEDIETKPTPEKSAEKGTDGEK